MSTEWEDPISGWPFGFNLHECPGRKVILSLKRRSVDGSLLTEGTLSSLINIQTVANKA